METKGKVMDLSKCGGVCKGDCKHYAIGLECPNGATYEQKDTDTIKVVPNQYMPEGVVMCGPETSKQLKAELDRLTTENAELTRQLRKSQMLLESSEALRKEGDVEAVALRGEVERLRKALTPFAKIGLRVIPKLDDDSAVQVEWPTKKNAKPVSMLTIKDFTRAQAALQGADRDA